MRHHRRGRNPDANKLIIYHNPTGSATFDPSITLLQAGTVIWETEVGRTVTTGTTHNLSYTPTAGPKICKVTVPGGISKIDGITCFNDDITEIKNIERCSIKTISYYGNLLALDISRIPNATYIFASQSISTSTIRGAISQFSRELTYLYAAWGAHLTGSISDFPATSETINISNAGGSATAGSVEHLINIKSLGISQKGWNQTGVNLVISSIWAARANYLYAAPSLQIGGTNAAPSGAYIAPEEGANWHRESESDPWTPLTGKAMIYDLINDVNGEGFNVWAITYTA